MTMKTIDRLTDEKGKSYPVLLDQRTGTFHVTVNGKSFKDGNLIKLKKAALARIAAVTDSKIEWKPFIVINLSRIKDHYTDFSLAFEYERRFFGTLVNDEEVWCWWGTDGKPEGDSRPWSDSSYDKVIRIPYKPKHWEALNRFMLAFSTFAESIHDRLKGDAGSFFEELQRGTIEFNVRTK